MTRAGAEDSKERRNRLVRDAGRHWRLTSRDAWIIESVAKLRFATTFQLARLHFGGSRWAANKRLRKLLDAGLVRAWVRSLAEENVYSLDRGGARLLNEPAGDQSSRAIPRGLDGNLDHLLAINQVRIALAVGLPEADGELAWWRSDWDLRAQRRGPVVPDALFRVRWEGARESDFALELDNKTRAPRAFLRKILRYRAALAPPGGLYGLRDPLLLVVGRDDRWLARYQEGVAHARVGTGIWFAALGEVENNGALAPLWRPATGDARVSLRELSSLLYRREGLAPKTHVFTAG